MGKNKKKQKDKKKKGKQHTKYKNRERYLTLIATIIGIIITSLQIYDWIEKNKKINIAVQNNIKISYLSQNDERYSNIFPLFDEYIDTKKEYQFSEKCATQLMITNHFESEIIIDKIFLEVDKIEVDYSPILFFREGNVLEEGLSIFVGNNGWGDAKNLFVKMTSKNQNLEEYFSKNALEFTVPVISLGEVIEVPFIQNADLITPCSNGTVFSVDFEVECENGTQTVIENNNVFFEVFDGKLVYAGMGSPTENVYGIKIDTNKNKFSWGEEILESIQSGETLVFPICFFPDKSCTMEFKILFEIVNNGNKAIISTPVTKTTFTVSSIHDYALVLRHSIDEKIVDTKDGEIGRASCRERV